MHKLSCSTIPFNVWALIHLQWERFYYISERCEILHIYVRILYWFLVNNQLFLITLTYRKTYNWSHFQPEIEVFLILKFTWVSSIAMDIKKYNFRMPSINFEVPCLKLVYWIYLESGIWTIHYFPGNYQQQLLLTVPKSLPCLQWQYCFPFRFAAAVAVLPVNLGTRP